MVLHSGEVFAMPFFRNEGLGCNGAPVPAGFTNINARGRCRHESIHRREHHTQVCIVRSAMWTGVQPVVRVIGKMPVPLQSQLWWPREIASLRSHDNCRHVTRTYQAVVISSLH